VSQRDLTAELRAARVTAPREVRERVRLISAADTTPPRRRLTRRRALVVALPVAAAVAASIVIARPSHERSASRTLPEQTIRAEAAPAQRKALTQQHGAVAGSDTGAPLVAPTPARGRAQRYGATLALRVASAKGVSDGVKRALQIASSLGGYATSVHASTRRGGATADLVLNVPRSHVQQALARLSSLGTITGEHVDVQDVQAGLNATDRTIGRLQRQLRKLRAGAQTESVLRQIETITARVARLQRAQAAAVRAAHFATVELSLATPAKAVSHGGDHGPLHGLAVAFRWIGIGAVYALALGTPLAVLLALVWLAARSLRRRREEALLSRP
jgi:hypothetical protein